jgi:hypothetical protein
MRTLEFKQLPADEQEDFISSCKRWRRAPHEFHVKAEERDEVPGLPAPMRRDVVVLHLPSRKARRYQAGHGSNWNAAFEDDLQARFFF